MLHFTSGDMFETPADLRVNTVNCVGVMGAGVAAAFKKRYPEMYRDYVRACKNGEVQPGRLHIWKTLTGEWVVNFPTKRHWKEKSRYEDIEAGLVELRKYLAAQGSVRMTLPALGCGHGGLSWEKVAPLIEQYLGDLPAEVFVFAPQDSHLHAQAEAERALGRLDIITADQPSFPQSLRRIHAEQVSAAGASATDVVFDVAIALSLKPTEKEEMAAFSVVEELARPGLSMAIPANNAAAKSLAQAALAKGAKVALWTSEGLARFQIPPGLQPAFATGDLALFSLAKTEQGWNPRLAIQNIAATVATSHASIFTGSSPQWLVEIDHVAPCSKLFYVRYGENADQESAWTDVGAAPIGRRASDKRPNLSAVLDSLPSQRRDGA